LLDGALSHLKSLQALEIAVRLGLLKQAAEVLSIGATACAPHASEWVARRQAD